MADTIPNIVVPAKTVVDIYADANVIAAGIVVGTQIRVKMIGEGEAKLFSGVALAIEPDNTTGYEPLYGKQAALNDAGDAGAFIWSTHGCTINVKEV